MFLDQTGHIVELKQPPQRIVSLVPSQTELLHDMGLEAEVVGITKFCVHPQTWFRSKTRIGGTKSVKSEIIRALQPDLILANKEENLKEEVEALREIAPVWTSDIQNLEGALDMIHGIGKMTDREEKAIAMIAEIRGRFAALEQIVSRSQQVQQLSTAYLIWRNPYMAAGGDTFIHDLLQRCGLSNVLASQLRYPALEPENLYELKPRLILLSSEPFPFKEKHIAELEAAIPGTMAMLVDGEMFSWYGSRLLKATAYFETLADKIQEKMNTSF